MIKHFRIVFRMILMVVISMLTGVVLLCGVYALPTEGRMFQNAQASACTFEKEGEPFSWADGNISGMLDNGTDSIMLRRAIFPGTGNVLEDVLQNPGYFYRDPSLMTIIRKALNQETEGRYVQNYGRYWHGYLLYLKPLLFWGTIGQIRMLNGMLQLLLAFYVLRVLGEKLGRKVQWAFLFTYLLLNPISIAMSLQYSSMYYIMMLACLLVLYQKDRLIERARYVYAFTAIGIGTAYFDFLTYPLISYGIPVIVFLLLLDQNKKIQEKWDGVVLVIRSGLAWGFGYGAMYLSKWLLLWWFIGYDAFQQAIMQIAYRMSDSVKVSEAILSGALSCSVEQAISLNLLVMLQNPICWLLLVILMITTVSNFLKRKKSEKKKVALKNALALIALSPFVWYAVFTNHSYVHLWFTYRELSIFIFAMSCYFIVKWQEYEK